MRYFCLVKLSILAAMCHQQFLQRLLLLLLIRTSLFRDSVQRDDEYFFITFLFCLFAALVEATVEKGNGSKPFNMDYDRICTDEFKVRDDGISLYSVIHERGIHSQHFLHYSQQETHICLLSEHLLFIFDCIPNTMGYYVWHWIDNKVIGTKIIY